MPRPSPAPDRLRWPAPGRLSHREPVDRRPAVWLLWPLLASLSACVVAPARAPIHRPVQVSRPAEAPTQPVFFYPERGQTEAEQDRDRYACYRWAVQQTGTDPGMTPVRQAVAPVQRPRAEPARGADGAVLGGAVLGGTLGAVAAPRHHTAEGVVLGAILGAAVGAASQADSAQRSSPPPAWRPPAPAPGPAVLSPFRRALSACMQGRGYAVG